MSDPKAWGRPYLERRYNALHKLLAQVRARIKAQTDVGLVSQFPHDEDPQHEFTELLVDLNEALESENSPVT